MDTRGEVTIYAIVARPVLAFWDAWLLRHQYAYERVAQIPDFAHVRDHGYFQATFRVWEDEEWEEYWTDPQCAADYQLYRVTLVDSLGWDFFFALNVNAHGAGVPPAAPAPVPSPAPDRDPFYYSPSGADEEGDYLFMAP